MLLGAGATARTAAQPASRMRVRDPVLAPPQASRWHFTSFLSVTLTKRQERPTICFQTRYFNNHIFSDNEVFLKSYI